MRKAMTLTALTVAAAAATIGPASATTIAPPHGSYYGPLAGVFKQLPTTSAKPCPIPPPSSSASNPPCASMTGTFTLASTGKTTVKGTFSGILALGSSSGASCTPMNAQFTFTTSRGNSFTATVAPSTDPSANQFCIANTGGTSQLIAYDNLSLQISSGTGMFKNTTGTVSEYGSVLPNVAPSGNLTSSGRTIGNLNVSFS